MNTRELAKATARFDQEFVIRESREPAVEEEALWQRAKRKRGRPKQGKGVQVISVSIEKGLLERADRLARRLKVRRTQLIAAGLEALLQRKTKRAEGQ
jgi:predicted transcriptional regulator